MTKTGAYRPRLKRREALAPGMSVGLLGGSFNPAHAGHVHVSETALKRLGLDRIWWLVSPQNPLKPADDMEPLADRLAVSRRVASAHPAIVVTDIERRLETRFTVDTARALVERFNAIRFVWLMGEDNLIQLPAWRGWTTLVDTLPFAVIARPGYCERATTSKAAIRFAGARLPETAAGTLKYRTPPAWVLLHDRLHPASATAIRRDRTRTDIDL